MYSDGKIKFSVLFWLLIAPPEEGGRGIDPEVAARIPIPTALHLLKTYKQVKAEANSFELWQARDFVKKHKDDWTPRSVWKEQQRKARLAKLNKAVT